MLYVTQVGVRLRPGQVAVKRGEQVDTDQRAAKKRKVMDAERACVHENCTARAAWPARTAWRGSTKQGHAHSASQRFPLRGAAVMFAPREDANGPVSN